MLMAEVEIPRRALFKPSEVCEIASLQPYILRSWESEFPDLGIAKGAAGSRVYRRSDVERVLRIKQLVFADGLTLAGVRRRIEEEAPSAVEEEEATPITELLGRNARERLAEVKKGLRAILDLLSSRPSDSAVQQFARAAAAAAPAHARRRAAPRAAKPARKPVRKRRR